MKTITGLEELKQAEGEVLGTSDWHEVTQADIDTFADVTGDHQWIHVDVERAKETPFGGTIAHGYFTVALLAPLLDELLTVQGASLSINYGIDKLRFPAPLPVGARFRAGAELREVDEIPGGVQMKLVATVEVEDSPKPALVAECLFRHYA